MGDVGALAIGAAMGGLALFTQTILLLPILGGHLRDRDAERDRPGHLVPGVPPPGAAHGARPPPLRGRRLAGVHGDRSVLADQRALRRGRARTLLRRLHQHPGGDRLMRLLVVGLAGTGAAVVEDARADGHEVVVVEDRPTGDAYVARAARARGAGRGACSRHPTSRECRATRRLRRTSSCRAPASDRTTRPSPRRHAPVCRCARRSTSPSSACAPACPRRGSSRSPGPTARPRSRR